MAVLLSAASTQYLSISTPIVSSVPVTMACWFKTSTVTAQQWIMTITDWQQGGGAELALVFRGTTAGDPLAIITDNDVPSSQALTTTGVSVNTWHHACGVLAATNSRSVYIDGGSKGTDTTNIGTPAGLDRFMIGARGTTASAPYIAVTGAVAEAGLWDVALTDAEVAILALGYSPSMVRPESLVGYWPLLDKATPSIDFAGGYSLDWLNSPTTTDHPRVLRPAGLWTGFTAAAGGGGGGGTIPVIYHHLRQQGIG